ncbi:MAG: hypothetical protein WCB18_09415 [Thermoplasmata archaeon]
MRSLSTIRAILALEMVTVSGRAPEVRTGIEEVIYPWKVSIVETLTPPAGPRRIEVSRWEDLLHAAALLGRPILRLQGGEGGSEGRLFYVADGPQSYVYDFQGTVMNVARAGAFVPAPSPLSAASTAAGARMAPPRVMAALPLPVEATAAPPETLEPGPTLSAHAATTSQVAPLPADIAWITEENETLADSEIPSATIVERRIREMIHELLAEFRQLPPSSDRLELGTEHIQRAIDMLHLGRFGVAQIELNKAAGLLQEPSPR